MTATIWRNPAVVAVLLIAILVVASMTFTIVPETRQAIVTSYGKVNRTQNAYVAGQPFGGTAAGLMARVPFVEQVQLIDKQVRGVQMERQDVLSTDQLRLSVDAYARYRIVDPVRMYTTIRNEGALDDQLRNILGSSLRNELGKVTFATLLSPERGAVMQNIRISLDREARKYGAEIIDVRIKRAEVPEGTPLESTYERMRTARAQEAITIQAQGQREAQVIQATADAEAARIYAESYGKDPAFYDFYRSMESYSRTFNRDNKGDSQIILSPDNDYLRNFRNGGGR